MALMVGHPGAVSQKLPKSRTNLSPIEEAGDSSSLVEPPGPPGDTSDSALRRKLLEGLESMSCPDLHSGLGLAPAVEEHSPLLLGDRRFLVQSRLLEHQSFSIYGAVTQESSVILKVEKDWSLWDFHMIRRLKTMSPEAAPEISCYLFEDSCITVYRAPPGCSISVLQECVAGEDSLQKLVPSLLHLLSLLRSCGLVHGDLQPGVLACVNSDLLHSTWLFPLKWSSSVDLDLQRDVVSLQQLPAAQTYISQGFLDPSASPHQVNMICSTASAIPQEALCDGTCSPFQLDQVGVAQTIHLLLTSRPMVPVEDSQGWTARDFKEERRSSFTLTALSLSPSLSLSLSLSLTHPLSHSLSLSYPLSYTPSLSHTICHTLSCSPSLSPNLSLSHLLSLTHTLSFSLSLSFSYTPLSHTICHARSFLSRALTLSLAVSFSLSLSLTHLLSPSLSLTPSLSHSPSLSLSLTPSLSLSLTHLLSPSLSLSLTPSLSHSPSLSLSLTPSLSLSLTHSLLSRALTLSRSVSPSHTSFLSLSSLTLSLTLSLFVHHQ
ncbi:uncharacterized protein LOC128768769 isoform X1 [Synchiropus splendidus]|uniref:uncharacterized protein LOC128768769 isoform X1 n=1 Tax=Synchiropus splendidus TaxID=270530 RepID=UPI00237D634C|nr:uncharacterized protein LOC128768769 isoform X1 [Synchiropus splendidus]